MADSSDTQTDADLGKGQQPDGATSRLSRLARIKVRLQQLIGGEGRKDLKERTDIEIHSWDGPKDPDNPYVCHGSLVLC